MSNSNTFGAKQAKHAATAGLAAHAATLATGTAAGTAFPLVAVMAAPATVSLPLVLGVGVAAYAASALFDWVFD